MKGKFKDSNKIKKRQREMFRISDESQHRLKGVNTGRNQQ